jgi:superfamily II DNA/RNA helicase
MFDAVTREFLASAPNLPDLPADELADQLTAAYAEIAAARITLTDDIAGLEERLGPLSLRMSQIADLLEAQVILGINPERTRPAAFAAASARQVLFQIGRLARTKTGSWADAHSISPDISAGILFMTAGRPSDAFEMARFIIADDDLPGPSRAAIIGVKHLLQGQLRLIFRLTTRQRYAPKRDFASPETAVGLLYRKIVTGLAGLAHEMLGREGGGLENALDAFRRIRDLSVSDASILELAAGEVRFETRSTFPGPHHLASLLERATPTFADAAIVKIGAPAGTSHEIWKDWVRAKARSWPYIWENHRRAVETGYLDSGVSAVLSSPTGSGKSTLATLKMVACLAGGRSVVYLAPTHALVSQFERSLTEDLPPSTSATSVEETLDAEIEQRLPEVAVMTPERCFALLTYVPEAFQNVGLLVFDECHLLGADNEANEEPDRRSIDAMLCLLSFVSTQPDADLLLMSAMISNGAELQSWLEALTHRACKLFEDEWKPTRQLKGAIVYDHQELRAIRNALAADWAARENKPSQAPVAVRALARATPYAVFLLSEHWNPHATDRYALRRLSDQREQLGVGKSKWGWTVTANRNQVAAAIAGEFQEGGLKAIVFCESIPTTGSVAKRLNGGRDDLALEFDEREQAWLDTAIAEVGSRDAVYAPGAGFAAVHHGELLPEERYLVESVFRRRRTGVNVLAATSTLAQGLNLPCELVVLAGTDRADDVAGQVKREDLKPHEILNALGRAGRAGFAATGLGMIVPADPIQCDPGTSRVADDPLLALAFAGNDKCMPVLDPVTILFDRIAAAGATTDGTIYLLRKLALGFAGDADEVGSFEQLGRRTFGYFVRSRQDAKAAEDWLGQRRASLQALIEAAQEEPVQDWQASLAAKTGASPAFIARLVAAYGEAPHESQSAQDWMRWLLGQLSPDEWEFDLFLRPSTFDRVFGRAFDQCANAAERRVLERGGALDALDAWLAGATLVDLEATITAFIRAHEGPVRNPTQADSKSKHARRFALRLAPDLGYLCGLIGYISRKIRADAGEAPMLILEALPQLVRKGLATPAHLYLIRSEALSRVQAQTRYKQLAPHFGADLVDTWEDLRNKVEHADMIRMFADD